MSTYEVGVSLMASGASGGMACMMMNPLDTLKVRYQVMPKAGMTLGAFGRDVVTTEGFVSGLLTPGVAANGVAIAISSMGRVGLYPFVRDAALEAGFERSGPLMFGCGLFAGGLGYLACSPIYQVKTLAQAECGTICGETGVLLTGARAGQQPLYHGRSLFASLAALQREKVLFRGAGTLMVRGALLSAGQQLGYDGAKTLARTQGIQDSPILHVAGSVCGGFCSAFFSTPADVVMTRYQAASSLGENYGGIGDCILQVFKADGIAGFYRGFLPFFLRLSPVFVISLPLTEQLRSLAGLGFM